MKNFLTHSLANWKTTSAGLTMIAGSVIHLAFRIKAGTADEQSWTIAIGAILGGIGLFAAGDAKPNNQNPPPQNNP